jgi:hypothetical protein
MNRLFVLLIPIALTACTPASDESLPEKGTAYQQTQSLEALQYVVDNLPAGSDTSFVKAILGEPIDMGFDYRYLVDSIGPNGCVMGAVFHIDDQGMIDQKWTGEICE